MTITAAIIGATGNQGGSVLRSLHTTGKYKLIAITRNTSSAAAKEIKAKYPDVELAAANVDDIESLKKAFKGADFVFGMTQFFQPEVMGKIEAGNLDVEYNQGKNIVDAAIDAGVKDVIFSTLPSMKEISGGKYTKVYHFEGKHKIEEYLLKSKADKIRGAAVRLGCFMDNYVNFSRISPEDNETVEFIIPLPPTKLLPLVDATNDTGIVVSYMLDNFDRFVGKSVDVSSGYYEAQEMVNAFKDVTGKPACYIQIPHADLNEEMEQMFLGIKEFELYDSDAKLLAFNKKLESKLTTPVEFWKNNGWTGPSQ
ncbi:hypothetical protein EV175_000433 [Coemansia sp. RSA 1933]|nr:hypothetical protein EV175_000433 [Coemansia sp. RSA 1933]